MNHVARLQRRAHCDTLRLFPYLHVDPRRPHPRRHNPRDHRRQHDRDLPVLGPDHHVEPANHRPDPDAIRQLDNPPVSPDGRRGWLILPILYSAAQP